MSHKSDEKRSWYEANKEKVIAYNREWRANNKTKVKAQNARYRATHKEELAAKHKEYEKENRKRVNEVKRAYKKKNPVSSRANRMHYYAKKTNSVPSWADKAQIKAFYIHAQFMSKHTGIPHEVDHIDPLRSDKVCGLHCHQNLQVITAEANRKKNNKFQEAA